MTLAQLNVLKNVIHGHQQQCKLSEQSFITAASQLVQAKLLFYPNSADFSIVAFNQRFRPAATDIMHHNLVPNPWDSTISPGSSSNYRSDERQEQITESSINSRIASFFVQEEQRLTIIQAYTIRLLKAQSKQGYSMPMDQLFQYLSDKLTITSKMGLIEQVEFQKALGQLKEREYLVFQNKPKKSRRENKNKDSISEGECDEGDDKLNIQDPSRIIVKYLP